MTSPNQSTITTFLSGHGLNRRAVAAVEGNLQVESGFNPAAYNPNEGAIGLAQWEGGRRTALQQYAATTGGSETSLQTQLGFLWQELSASPVLGQIQSAPTAGAGAAAFDAGYERSAGTTRTQRVNNATSIYGQLTGQLPPGGTATGNTSATGTPAIGNPLNVPGDIASGITSGLASLAHPLGRWMLDAGTVAAGIVMAVLGVYLAAHGASETLTQHDNQDQDQAAGPSSSSPGSSFRRGQSPRHAAETAAEDAPEVAAV